MILAKPKIQLIELLFMSALKVPENSACGSTCDPALVRTRAQLTDLVPFRLCRPAENRPKPSNFTNFPGKYSNGKAGRFGLDDSLSSHAKVFLDPQL